MVQFRIALFYLFDSRRLFMGQPDPVMIPLLFYLFDPVRLAWNGSSFIFGYFGVISKNQTTPYRTQTTPVFLPSLV